MIPEPLNDPVIRLDGYEPRPVEVGQADIPHNTVLHVPALDAVIAGDVTYNGINPFLAVSSPDERLQWIASIDKIAALKPRIVVAGHKRPELPDDDLAATLDATRDYIRHFIDELATSADSRELVARMQRRYPEHGNPSALVLSAATAFSRKKDNQ